MASPLVACRGAFRRNTVPFSLALTTGLVMVNRQRPMRCDSAIPVSVPGSRHGSTGHRKKERLNSEIIKQLSGGSLSGFCAGLLVSVFSRTLVLLMGVSIVFIQVASRYGINVVEQLNLKKRVESSKILTMLSKNTAFKVAFGASFALSAFMSF
ncbi:hypothetical protein B0T26DRAFT_646483 [Lasiosphaeria miniovina]|uniref:FUN14 family protein n=1 Tax=Lasiosphaeria miniovina TaxID=1954250 RepID=A0AA40AM47_9PEZI|nr:uncharacterized protein B0T26DRAFT_646483 [Lasiosphaeria miniovina]KAK0718364.1 hypothetical protein B0T26DRAFT_646483 [Lasiosphaeria miniovina]